MYLLYVFLLSNNEISIIIDVYFVFQEIQAGFGSLGDKEYLEFLTL